MWAPHCVADEQRVALRVVAGVVRPLADADEAAVGVLPVPGGDALRHDRAAGPLPEVDHLGAGVRLLPVVGHRHRVELAHRVVALQDAGGVLPGDRGAGLDLGPGDLGPGARALAALGDEVVDPALPVLVARVPVLDGRVLDLRVVERHELDDRGVQLVLVAHRGRASLEVAHVGAFLRDDQRPLELAGVRGVDAEVGAELHRAAHALRHEDEGAVGEDGGVEGGEEVVRVRDHGPEVLTHEVGVLLAPPRRRSRRRRRPPSASP